MNNIARPKISSLSEKALAALLMKNYFKLGRTIKLNEAETKIFLGEIYKYQGWMYIDSFEDAFSRYAAEEMVGAENLFPKVSNKFISRLMKLSINGAKKVKSSRNPVVSTFTSENRFNLLVNYIRSYRQLPANPDWIAIYEYMASQSMVNSNASWETISFNQKLKHAESAVTDWAYNHHNIAV